MGQKSQTRLIREDAKFAPSKTCELCGHPTRSASVRCSTCLDKIFLAEELIYVREWLRAHPGTLIELAHDARKRVHLVLFRARNLGWCGAAVTERRATRKWATPGTFPSEACVQCLAAYGA